MDRYNPKCKFRTESSSTCDENEIRNTRYDNTYSESGSSLSDSVPSKDNVDLSLELEIDEGSKHIIVKPKRRNSTLVNVHTIKQTVGNSSAQNEGRNTRQHENENRRKLLEECKHKLKGKNEEIPKRSKYVNQHAQKDIGVMSAPISPNSNKHEFCNKTFNGFTKEGEVVSYSIGTVQPIYTNVAKQATEDAVGDQGNNKRQNKKRKAYMPSNENKSEDGLLHEQLKAVPVIGDTTRHVYATIKTMDHLRKVFPCQHPNENRNKPDRPCVCEHCGVVGVLIDSQKRPMVYNSEEELADISDSKYYKIPPSKDWKPSVSSGTPDIINELNERVRMLEIRLQRHEARSVSKDYFKRVINKLVSYIQPRYDQVLHLDQVHKSPLKKNMSTQYSKAVSKKDTPNKHHSNNYCVRPVVIETEASKGKSLNATCEKSSEKQVSADSSLNHLQCFWRWGEEIVRPGIDLKDKMIALLEEKLSNFKSVPQKRPTMDIEISCVESDKTIFLRGSNDKIPTQQQNATNKPRAAKGDQDASNFKKILDVMSTKIYEDYIQNQVCNTSPPETSTKCNRNVRKDAHCKIPRQNTQMQNSNIKKQVIGQQRALQNSPYNQQIKSGIPIRRPDSPKGDIKKSMIPKLQRNYTKPLYNPFNTAEIQRGRFYSDVNKSALRKHQYINEEQPVQITYVNPRVNSWFEESCTYLKDVEIGQKPDGNYVLHENKKIVNDTSKCDVVE